MQRRAGFGRSGGRSRLLFFTLLGLRGVYKVFIALGAPDRLEPDFTSRRRSLAQLGSRGRGLNSPPLEGVRRGVRGEGARDGGAPRGWGRSGGRRASMAINEGRGCVCESAGSAFWLPPRAGFCKLPSSFYLMQPSYPLLQAMRHLGRISAAFLPVPAGGPRRRVFEAWPHRPSPPEAGGSARRGGTGCNSQGQGRR